ncbi:MAG: class I SAM-dependent methyltransferase [Candidatus Omnitrophica bacterium]|nr:class I SAM-dependent methyltransferase [Candidatus Omnitrophota bacterium]MBU4488503.1 class I SAM-dependent methyltransferase [Candidatus Omnitrophota bacterium]MCG2704585.1 class I SAM-dependent methyltransferase [Candidatus Omnitrophota bacterium]
MKNLKNSFHKYAERIELYKRFGCDIEKERKFILEKASPLSGDILEIGTGKGYMAITLAQLGLNFTTVDISAEEQEFARQNIKHLNLERFVDFRIENAEALNFQNDSFDIALSVNTLHHLKNPFKVIDEMLRVLRPGGRIVLSDFTKKGFSIIEMIHKMEGRKHDAHTVKLVDVKKYLKDQNLVFEESSSKYQEVFIVHKK